MAKQSEKALGGNCVKNNCRNAANEEMKNLLIAPFENITPDLKKLFSYFLHLAPDVESVHSSEIAVEFHEDAFNRMIEGRRFDYKKICAANAQIQRQLEEGFLYGDVLCLKCKRYVCKRKQRKNNQPQETDLDCFLRHIRNAIAHGRVYCSRSSNNIHIVFEDINASKNISARIVCVQADLKHWKSVLNDFARKG